MDELAKRLREELKARGITQNNLAEKLGTTQPVISRTLRASVTNERSHWPAIIDLLDMEITVQPKGKGHK